MKTGGRRLLALAVTLAGCGTPTGGGPVGAQQMVLGTVDAQAQWAALTDGQDATLVEGAQGGFHVWMKLRLSGVAPGPVGLSREAHRLSDGETILRSPDNALTVGDPGPDGFWEQPDPMPMFMCPSPINVSVIDVPIVYRVALSDGNSPLADAEITLVPRCPADYLAFCQKICTG